MMNERLAQVVAELNRIEKEKHLAKGYHNFPADEWKIKKEGKKFIYLDCGGSGAFLIEKETGELYNIKGYGVPDYSKKQKANIGNIGSVVPETLHNCRYNYLRN